jgi:hypothetical protein
MIGRTKMFKYLWEDIKDGDLMSIAIAVLMLAVVAMFVFLFAFALDFVIVGEPTYFKAEVVDGLYQPDTTQTNVSPVIGIGSNGQMVSGVAVSSSGSPESFTLMIRDYRTLEIYAIEVTPTVYYTVFIGDVVQIEEKLGKILGQPHRTVLP